MFKCYYNWYNIIMRNQWEAFDDDDEVEIPKTTSNPIRKIKKK